MKRSFLTLVIFLAVQCVVSLAQAANEDGVKLYGSYHGSDIDNVSLTSGHLELRIPLLDYPQRGGKLGLTFIARYHTAVWNQTQDCGSGDKCIHTYYWDMDSQPSVQVLAEQSAPTISMDTFQASIVFSDESQHPIGMTATNLWESLDASSMKYDGATGTIYFPNGSRIYNLPNPPGGQTMEDTNGNQITFGSTGTITDTLGRTIPNPQFTQFLQSTTNFTGCTGLLQINSAWLWNVPGENGLIIPVKLCYVAVHIFTHHFTVDDSTHIEPNQDFLALQSIVLPDNITWTFDYSQPDASGINWGDLVKITLPTGGTISYTWDHPVGCQVPYGHVGSTSSRMLSRTVDANDGTGPHTWNYAITSASATVTDPALNDTVHVFTDFNTSCSLFETQTQFYSGTGASRSLLQTVTTDFAWAPNPNVASPNPQPAMNVVPIRKTINWSNGRTKKTEFGYDAGFGFTSTQSTGSHGIYGRQVAQRDFDWGDGGSPGPLLRITNTAYAWQSNGSYLTYNIIDSPVSVTTLDPAGTQVAQSLLSYDESVPAPSGISVSHNLTPPNGNIRGNLTTASHWLNGSTVSTPTCPVVVSNGNITESTSYLDTGMPSQSADPCGHSTTTQYAATPYAGAYPTQSCDALNHCSTMSYDLNTGQLASVTDPNSNTTTNTYDDIGRLSSIVYPDSGQVTFSYPNAVTVEKKRLLNSAAGLWIDKYFYFDGLGRLTQSRVVDPEGDVFAETTYDALGRVATASNPHRSAASATDGVTQYQYDPLGRTVRTSLQDGSFSTMDYSLATCTTSTDEAGKQRKACTDGLGRLINVFEDPAGLNYETDYQYNARGNLVRVDQRGSAPTDSLQWRTRLFTYDSLSRLLTAQNPESGLISYAYDADGNLLQKTSPAPNQTGTATTAITYCYDPLHRLTAEGYSNSPSPPQQCVATPPFLPTPAVTESYDQGANGIGRLTSLTDQAGSGSYSYDAMARISAETRVISGFSKSLSYGYNLDGSLKTLTYPSGATITYTPVSFTPSGAGSAITAGRTGLVQDLANGINYVTGTNYSTGATGLGAFASHWPNGADASFRNGYSATFSGITHSFSYNQRLQPCRIAAGTSAMPGFCLDGANQGNVLDIAYDFHVGTGASGADNGNVFAIANNKDATRSQTFAYDALNRLVTAQNTGTDCGVLVLQDKTKYWGNSYGYDAWGNLISKSVSKCSAENLTLTALANNQLSGYGYDAAGNMTSDPTDGVSASYDAENRIASATKDGVTSSYVYDADGNRVEKVTPPPPATPSSGTLYWYMTPGIVAESDLAGNLKSEYVFFNGERVARRDFDPSTGTATGVSYYFSDHLKTASVITDSAGNIQAESDYYPWGGELQFVNNDSNHYKFTGKERDSESGLDYFGARYYSNGLGRFLTPDWAAKATAVPYAEFSDPQSLNLYSYVRNIPTVNADPDGHEIPAVDVDPSRAVDSAKFLGEELLGLGKAVINAVPEAYNAGASFLNEQIASSPNLQDVPALPLAPTLSVNGPGQAVGAAVANVAMTAASGARSSEGTSVKAADDPHPSVQQPYQRPSGATTAEQRASVQGKPCVDCGKTAPKMIANHKTALVKEYYQTGKIDKAKMRSVGAVNSHCPTCSARSGGHLSNYSKRMKSKLEER